MLSNDNMLSANSDTDIKNKGFALLDEMFKNYHMTPKQIIEKEELRQISDISQIEAMIDEILAKNAAQVEKYKNGEVKLFGFFVGESMKKSQGKANPAVINEILKKKLS